MAKRKSEAPKEPTACPQCGELVSYGEMTEHLLSHDVGPDMEPSVPIKPMSPTRDTPPQQPPQAGGIDPVMIAGLAQQYGPVLEPILAPIIAKLSQEANRADINAAVKALGEQLPKVVDQMVAQRIDQAMGAFEQKLSGMLSQGAMAAPQPGVPAQPQSNGGMGDDIKGMVMRQLLGSIIPQQQPASFAGIAELAKAIGALAELEGVVMNRVMGPIERAKRETLQEVSMLARLSGNPDLDKIADIMNRGRDANAP